jgi:hypothetical protein
VNKREAIASQLIAFLCNFSINSQSEKLHKTLRSPSPPPPSSDATDGLAKCSAADLALASPLSRSPLPSWRKSSTQSPIAFSNALNSTASVDQGV